MSEKIKFDDVVAISGMPGLHKIVGRSKGGLVIELLDESHRRQAVPMNNKVSVLAEIAMFTPTEDVKLGQIIKKLIDENVAAPNKGAKPDEVKAFMSKALPGYDEARVYVSHMEKLAKWYVVLKDVVDMETLVVIEDDAEEAIIEPTAVAETAAEPQKEEV